MAGAYRTEFAFRIRQSFGNAQIQLVCELLSDQGDNPNLRHVVQEKGSVKFDKCSVGLFHQAGVTVRNMV